MIATILCDRADSIATISLSNPGKMNAMNATMWRELRQTVQQLAEDPDIRSIILRGAGEVFAAGGDIEELREARATVDSALAYHETVGQVLQAIEQLPQPTIAAIQGPCAGAEPRAHEAHAHRRRHPEVGAAHRHSHGNADGGHVAGGNRAAAAGE